MAELLQKPSQEISFDLDQLALLDLVRARPVRKVEHVLDHGADANSRDEDDSTASIVTSNTKHSDVVSPLMARGARS
jgi:hypothetical protein